jgi:hypothetical protein
VTNRLNRKVVLGLALFFIGVILLEGNGYIIHHDLYEQGLQFSPAWVEKDNLIKLALYQFLIFTVLFVHESWPVWALTEVFWVTCSHDLVFYLIWNRGVFPAEDWSWLPFFSIFGHWNLASQVMLSLTSLASVGSLLWLMKRWRPARAPRIQAR